MATSPGSVGDDDNDRTVFTDEQEAQLQTLMSQVNNDLGTGQLDLLETETVMDPATGQEYKGLDSNSASVWQQHFEHLEAQRSEYLWAKETQKTLQKKRDRIRESREAVQVTLGFAQAATKKISSSNVAAVVNETKQMINTLLSKHPDWLPEIEKLAASVLEPVADSVDTAIDQLKTLEEASGQLDKDFATLRTDLDSWDQAVTTLKREQEQLVSSKELLESKNQDLGIQYQELNKRNGELVLKDTALSSENNELTKKYGSLGKAHTALMAEKQELEKVRDKLASGKQSLQSQFDKMQLEKQVLEENYRTVSVSLKSMTSKHDKLVTEKADLRKAQAQLVKDHESLSSANDDLAEMKSKLQESYDQLKSSHDELISNHESLIIEEKKIRKSHEKLTSDANSFRGKYDRLKSDHETLLGEEKKLRASQEILVVEEKKLRKSHESLLVEEKKLRSSHESLLIQEKKFRTSHEKLTPELNSLQEKYGELMSSHENLVSEVKTLRESHGKLILEHNELQNRYSTQAKALEDAEAAKSAAEKERDEERLKSQQMTPLAAEVPGLRKNFQEAQTRADILQQELQQVSKQAEELNKNLKESQAETESLLDLAQKQNSRIEGLNRDLNVAQAESGHLSNLAQAELERAAQVQRVMCHLDKQLLALRLSARRTLRPLSIMLERCQVGFRGSSKLLFRATKRNIVLKLGQKDRRKAWREKEQDLRLKIAALESKNGTLQAALVDAEGQVEEVRRNRDVVLGDLADANAELDDIEDQRDRQIKLKDEAIQRVEAQRRHYEDRLETVCQEKEKKTKGLHEVLRLIVNVDLDCGAVEESCRELQTYPRPSGATIIMKGDLLAIEGLTGRRSSDKSMVDQARAMFLSAHSASGQLSVAEVQCFANGLTECESEALSISVPIVQATVEKLAERSDKSFNSSLIWLMMFDVLLVCLDRTDSQALLSSCLQRATPRLHTERLLIQATIQHIASRVSGGGKTLGDSIIAVATERGLVVQAEEFSLSMDGEYLLAISEDKTVGFIRPSQVRFEYGEYMEQLLIFKDAPLLGSRTVQAREWEDDLMEVPRRLASLVTRTDDSPESEKPSDMDMFDLGS